MLKNTNEIGSDFYDIERTGTQFILSGRTAEEFIIRDILETQAVKSALLPSFCCYTMIEPFQKHNIPVKFYDVVFDNELKAILPEKRDGEVLLYLDYFGFYKVKGLENVNDWDITIEDCTHSWVQGRKTDADYSFISYRKWTGFTAIARADKKRGQFVAKLDDGQNIAYESYRKRAMDLKKKYLKCGGKKDDYLKQFQEAEELLEIDYAGYRPSYESLMNFFSLDVDLMKDKRKINAQILFDGLSDIKQIRFIYSRMLDTDVPLNVPIMVDNGLRNELRKYLINARIYCPIHWPLSELHSISYDAKEIYEKEISLICDQRYGKTDMEREVQVIRNFFST